MRSRRLELPRAFAHNDLNVTRLPVPPRPHIRVSDRVGSSGRRRPLAKGLAWCNHPCHAFFDVRVRSSECGVQRGPGLKVRSKPCPPLGMSNRESRRCGPSRRAARSALSACAFAERIVSLRRARRALPQTPAARPACLAALVHDNGRVGENELAARHLPKGLWLISVICRPTSARAPARSRD